MKHDTTPPPPPLGCWKHSYEQGFNLDKHWPGLDGYGVLASMPRQLLTLQIKFRNVHERKRKERIKLIETIESNLWQTQQQRQSNEDNNNKYWKR